MSKEFSGYHPEYISPQIRLVSPINFIWPDFSPELNIGVMASGEGTNFEALVKSCRYGYLKANVSALIVNKEGINAIEKANNFGIPSYFVNQNNFSTREYFEQEIINIFTQNNVEIVVMAGWMRIVSSKLINKYNNRLINIHPSLLPSFKGLDAVQKAIDYGVRISGCTVHLVSSEVDSGPILIQSAVPILRSDDKFTLLKKIQFEEHKILPIGVAIAAEKFRCL